MFLICSTISLHFFDSFTPILHIYVYIYIFCVPYVFSLTVNIGLEMINCYRLLLLGKYRHPRNHRDDSFSFPAPREPKI